MARMLSYRELPEEQFKLLRRVFAYVDSDGDGKLTPAELRAVVERFGCGWRRHSSTATSRSSTRR